MTYINKQGTNTWLSKQHSAGISKGLLSKVYSKALLGYPYHCDGLITWQLERYSKKWAKIMKKFQEWCNA